ncbi:hypothetical protein [Pedobacter polysacchareus]|uniref:hypothetical protein n=1 Tax=Pedobacter polysacchareus TaxID=2861973 RepID=UPI001C995775|nr:hypothetical protein [Pedobacter polysacchareus]
MVDQKKGGVKYAVDLLINPKGIELKLGGIYVEKGNIIIGGRIGITSDDPFSINLYNSFSKKIKQKFKRIGTSYVGKDAEVKLNAGWHLVTSVNSIEAFGSSRSRNNEENES